MLTELKKTLDEALVWMNSGDIFWGYYVDEVEKLVKISIKLFEQYDGEVIYDQGELNQYKDTLHTTIAMITTADVNLIRKYLKQTIDLISTYEQKKSEFNYQNITRSLNRLVKKMKNLEY